MVNDKPQQTHATDKPHFHRDHLFLVLVVQMEIVDQIGHDLVKYGIRRRGVDQVSVANEKGIVNQGWPVVASSIDNGIEFASNAKQKDQVVGRVTTVESGGRVAKGVAKRLGVWLGVGGAGSTVGGLAGSDCRKCRQCRQRRGSRRRRRRRGRHQHQRQRQRQQRRQRRQWGGIDGQRYRRRRSDIIARKQMDIVDGTAMALQEIAADKAQGTSETVERFFVGVGALVALFVFQAGEGSSAKGADVLLLRTHEWPNHLMTSWRRQLYLSQHSQRILFFRCWLDWVNAPRNLI